jgi:CcmD family protein
MRVVVFLLLLLSTPVIAQQPSPQSAPPKQQEEFVPVSQLPPQDQLPAAPLLVTAYAFVWIALFGYVVSVARRLTKVQREVERLEADMKRGTRA